MVLLKKFFQRMALPISFLCVCSPSLAEDWLDGFSLEKKAGDRYALTVSPYTRHFSNNPEHKHVWLLGIERERKNDSVAGIAFFNNSFGQHSLYYYPWGASYRNLLGEPQLYAKVTAGLLYGYRGQYEDKVPLNYNGFSPGIVPALGWDLGDGFGLQANFLGFNAVMIQFALPLK